MKFFRLLIIVFVLLFAAVNFNTVHAGHVVPTGGYYCNGTCVDNICSACGFACNGMGGRMTTDVPEGSTSSVTSGETETASELWVDLFLILLRAVS